jgi:hypothetical protein
MTVLLGGESVREDAHQVFLGNADTVIRHLASRAWFFSMEVKTTSRKLKFLALCSETESAYRNWLAQ